MVAEYKLLKKAKKKLEIAKANYMQAERNMIKAMVDAKVTKYKSVELESHSKKQFGIDRKGFN